MDWKVFATVFLAELGDKTQLATVLFSADKPGAKWIVFAASASALVIASAIGVLAGSFVSQHINPKHLQVIAGVGFVVIGLWTLRAGLAGT
ncbi:MAG: TMEM165/GDT1 family protein [Panacagrimonas sp.]